MTGPIAVVGATGVLRPAALRLVAEGHPVLAVARSPIALAALAASAPLITLATDERLGGAIVYGPATGGTTPPADGPVVLVLTSSTAAPPWSLADLPPAPGVRRLVLGWHPAGRWHSAEEISAAALDLFAAPADEDRVLGVVEPWTERPA